MFISYNSGSGVFSLGSIRTHVEISHLVAVVCISKFRTNASKINRKLQLSKCFYKNSEGIVIDLRQSKIKMQEKLFKNCNFFRSVPEI